MQAYISAPNSEILSRWRINDEELRKRLSKTWNNFCFFINYNRHVTPVSAIGTFCERAVKPMALHSTLESRYITEQYNTNVHSTKTKIVHVKLWPDSQKT